MVLTIKKRILFMVSLITLCSLLGFVILILDIYFIGQGLKQEKSEHAKTFVVNRALKIHANMTLMQRLASELAKTGEIFFRIKHESPQALPDSIVQDYLRAAFSTAPEAIGGGLWYEPFLFDSHRRYFGPYVFRENDTITFTWNLNTPEYDYHHQDWYESALPEDPAKKQNLKNIHWTDPYLDDVGTNSLMITVSALMKDGSDQIIGLSTVDFSLDAMQKMVAEMLITPHSMAVAVDVSSRKLIACSSDSKMIMQDISTLSFGGGVLSAQDSTIGLIETKTIIKDGEDYSLFATPVGTDVVLALLVPNEELYDDINDMQAYAVDILAVVILVQLLLSVVIIWLLIKYISRPINHTISLARLIAEGDLVQTESSVDANDGFVRGNRDEIGELLSAFKTMTENLSGLVRQLKASGVRVKTTSTEIMASAREIETTIAEHAAATRQVSDFSQRIFNTSSDLAESTEEATAAVKETADLASSGREKIRRMQETMNHVEDAAGALSKNLTEINAKTADINTIVTTITKVADKINLLSMNAAIESEKAGEYGLGFAVVAREIRRLADHTVMAVSEIEHMISKIRTSVLTGTTEIEKFSHEVKNGVVEVGEVGQQLEGIMVRVQILPDRLGALNKGMVAQSRNAGQISETLGELNTTIQHATETLHEFSSATDQLNDVVQILEDQVARFNVSIKDDASLGQPVDLKHDSEVLTPGDEDSSNTGS